MAVLLALFPKMLVAQVLFINEIHYDNEGLDVNEGVEVLGSAGLSLSDFQLVFYNGTDGRCYQTVALSGSLPDEGGSGFGASFVEISGIQNGSPDGIALYRESDRTVLQFLSYEGDFIATDGVADRMRSSNIEVAESENSDSAGSLQLRGAGSSYADFSWEHSSMHSPGRVNADQTLTGPPPAIIRVKLTPDSVSEDAGFEAVQLYIELVPPPVSDRAISLSIETDAPDRLEIPAEVLIPPNGRVAVFLSPLDNDLPDVKRSVNVSVKVADLNYPSASVDLILIDTDPPSRASEVLRVASFNLFNGSGRSNTLAFQAAEQILSRIHPDVIAFQEVSSLNGFAELKVLLDRLAFETDRVHFAVQGDGFEAAIPENGQFASNQFVAIASRYPVKRAIQIGRGQDDRRELTRYPLFVALDVPWTENDPVFVAVHLKAGHSLADRFRRAVEAFRINEFLQENEGIAGDSNFMILGDFNEDRQDGGGRPGGFQSAGISGGHRFFDGSTLPLSYRLGTDLQERRRVLPYGRFPRDAFPDRGMIDLVPTQADRNVQETFHLHPSATLDYILVNETWHDRGKIHAEIYNSLLDNRYDGLKKIGHPLEAELSRRASDHHVIYADLLLDDTPSLTLELEESELLEIGRTIPGTISLEEAAPRDLSVTLELGSHGHAQLDARTVIVEAGSSMAAFEVMPITDGIPDPHHGLTITARADGYAADLAFLRIRNADASGRLLISQYREPAVGVPGKAIELYNNTHETIDFEQTPLTIDVFLDGETKPFLDTELSEGRLASGAVLVIGGQAVENALRREGILFQDLIAFDRGDLGLAFLTKAGHTVFVRDELSFDGDDALEIQLGHVLSDVFGRVGTDPGRRWLKNGVSTADATIALRPLAMFPSTGFTNPSWRFAAVPFTEGLAGFGVAPETNHAYRNWLNGFGIHSTFAAFAGDPDRDGLTNVEEFALVSDPLKPTRHPLAAARTFAGQWMFQFRRRDKAPVEISLDTSKNLIDWHGPAHPVSETAVREGDDVLRLTWTLPSGADPLSTSNGQYYRLRLELKP